MDFLLFLYRHKSPLTLVKNQDGFYYALILFMTTTINPGCLSSFLYGASEVSNLAKDHLMQLNCNIKL